MDKIEMERLFERLLSESGVAGQDDGVDRVAFLRALRQVKAGELGGDAADNLAAYLDGALDAQELDRYATLLAAAPAELYELDSADMFLDAVSSKETTAPAELVAAAAQDAQRQQVKSVVKRSRFLNSAAWGRQFAWTGGGAAALAATVVIAIAMNQHDGQPFLASGTNMRIADVEPVAQPAQPVFVEQSQPVRVAPPKVETPAPTRQMQAISPRNDVDSLEKRVPSAAAEGERGQQTLSDVAQLRDKDDRSVVAMAPPSPVAAAIAPPAPPASPPAMRALTAPAAPKEEIPETALITGSLVRGSAAVGVPVTNLSSRDFAQTGALKSSDLFRAPQAAPGFIAQLQQQTQAGAIVGEARAFPGASLQNTERYPNAAVSATKLVSAEPVSTFSVDVDTASYANVRRFLNQGVLPPVDAVRVEEMVNYFDYAYAVPRDRSAPFQPTVAVYPSPWNPDTQILHIGIKGFELAKSERPKANLVFLIDVSGSMNEPAKLPLLKRSFQLLVNQLRPEDRVAIVVYAGRAGTVLAPTPGSEKEAILEAIERMQAGGSTAGGEGIRQAYELAKANFDKNGVNRVILATDGDFNVGITDPKQLEDFIARERSSGVFLTVLGFGGGNYNDATMQKLAQAGNGTAAYIDTINEARKVFVDEIGSTLFTIAKDVKIQIEFNPARVAEYRLIGYETRALNRADFNNDKVDAGDIGSGHTVTALYEITPVGSRAQTSDPLRYGPPSVANVTPTPQGEYAFLKIRYKLPNEDESKLITRPIVDRDVIGNFGRLPVDLRFAAAVAGSAQLLRHDPYIKNFDYNQAIEMAQAAKGDDEFGYRNEFVQLLRMAQTAASLQPLDRVRPTVRQ